MLTPFPIASVAIYLVAATLLGLLVIWSAFAAERLFVNKLKSHYLLAFSLCGLVFAAAWPLVSELGGHRALLAFALSGSFLLGLLHPVIAACVMSSLLFLRPWELAPNGELLATIPRLSAMVACISLIVHKLARRDFFIVWNTGLTLFALLVGWFYVSTVLSGNSPNGFAIISEAFVPISVLLLLVANVFQSKQDLRMLEYSLVISVASMVATAALLGSLTNTGDDFSAEETALRLSGAGMWANSNDLAALMVLALPFAARRVLSAEEHWLERLLMSALGAVLLFGLYQAQSRGAILALGVIIIAILVHRGTIKALFSARSISPGMIVVVCALIVAPIILLFGISREASDLSESASARLSYLYAGLGMAKDYPLFGVGIGNYPARYEQYAPSFVEWGERTAHSSWVLPLAETGIPGLLIFVTLIGAAVFRAYRVRLESPQYLWAWLGYGVSMSFLSHTYLITPYLLLGMTLVASRREQMAEGAALTEPNVQESGRPRRPLIDGRGNSDALALARS